MKRDITIKNTLLFLIPSLIGIFLFMTPLPSVDGDGNSTVQLPVKFAADTVMDVVPENGLILTVAIVMAISAVLSIIATASKGNQSEKSSFWFDIFATTPIWIVVRIVGAIFGFMAYFGFGPEFIVSGDTGSLLLADLLPFLFTIFLFAGLLLPLLLNFGLMEFFGSLLKNIMRPLFRLPGRASIDSIASWVGDGTVGIMMSNQQYESGKYTAREASIVASAFSVVSITFSITILAMLDITHLFWQFFLTLFVAGFIAAVITPRIPPLSLKSTKYIDGSEGREEPKVKQPFSSGFVQAVTRAEDSFKNGDNIKSGLKNVFDLWFGVLPVVMAIGTLAAGVATFTPVFEWLAVPFVPILELMNVPEAAAASQTLLIGFADMLLPAIIADSLGITTELTLFIIAALSVSQLIYMSETGGVLIASKIPFTFLDAVLVFVIRTIITLPIIVLMAHILL
ncbi:nucleoside recognition membrane protein YjiH [Alkalihalobacillus xiaoxiensis]|uniref:Nucleoside recognition membrane protein YjiH n=1 Tax=Shouchella xiaoxiensis TaxID=766895 RepID=A0ABS2SYH7_9BACI|nr:YjiH family protein [Shouchella xiaoxiensis]MBM7840574.1 nucleoside recognition membrane protein YjiH [Shouchella xiaoxiensis]